MNTLIDFLHSGIASIIPTVVLLGLLITVHELGHFLVAKYYKVRVEVFSLGFGPKIFKYLKGETVYAVSAIPLGGYVKMFGDDPNAAVPEDQKKYAFNHKPVGQRIAVVLAGPLMNLFFAVVLFMGVALIGEQALSPILGDIATESAAYKAGFRSGDVVQKVDGQSVRTWDEFQKGIETSANRSLNVEVLRENQTASLTVNPPLVKNKNVLSWDRMVGDIDGLTFSSRASVLGIPDTQSLAAKAGLRSGDVVTEINGQKVDRWRDLDSTLNAQATNGRLNIKVSRMAASEDKDDAPTEHVVKMTLTPAVQKQIASSGALATLGIEFPELFLASFEKDSPAQKAGLRRGDRLMSINGQKLAAFDDVVGIIRNYKSEEPLKIDILRDGQTSQVIVSPNIKERMNLQGQEEKRYEIGIRPMVLEAAPATFTLQTSHPGEALQRGISQSIRWTSLTVLSFVRLFQAEVSAKNIGGFISIGQMAKKTWQIGAAPFLNIMAIISINLFILNLLPVPVLDGGHLVFFSIEAIRGAPLSMRKLELAQQVGMILLLGLMVFALFNDVTRLFH